MPKHLLNLIGTHMVLAVILVGPGQSSAETDLERTIIGHLDYLRTVAVTKDPKRLKELNERLDKIWRDFEKNKQDTIPILSRHLKLELKKPRPSDFLLLDIGLFLFSNGKKDSKTNASEALFSLNPASDIIIANYRQLFNFTFAVSEAKDPRILDFIDRVFLPNRGRSLYIPQHTMRLDPTLICVFLYGVYGPESGTYLGKLLSSGSPESVRILELLIWIGSAESVEPVRKEMLTHRDHETFARALTFMMKVGGPKGRAVMLGVDERDLDIKSRDYYRRSRKDIKTVSYESMYNRFLNFTGDKNLAHDKLKKRLEDMHKNYGKDDKTSPLAPLNSELPKTFLIEKLLEIRSRMFHRLSDEALDDVILTNAIINTLRYRSN